MFWFTVLGILLVVFSYVAVSRRTKLLAKAAPFRPTPTQSKDAKAIETAKVKVDELIASGRGFLVESGGDRSPHLTELGPATLRFFSDYGGLVSKFSGFRVSAADVKPSDYEPGYLSIGHSEDWDIIQWPGQDEVLVVEGGETCESQMNVRFPSVYHLILDEAQNED